MDMLKEEMRTTRRQGPKEPSKTDLKGLGVNKYMGQDCKFWRDANWLSGLLNAILTIYEDDDNNKKKGGGDRKRQRK